MKRLKDFGYWVAFMLLVLPGVCAKVAKGQRPPVMTGFWTASEIRYDPSLPWISEYSQPPIYRVWWLEIAECEGFPAPPESLTSRVQFFQINSRQFMPDGIHAVALAITYGDAGQIFMAAPYIWQKTAIQHEMLHMILHWLGYRMGNYHPPEIFEKCSLHASGYQ